MVAIAVVAFSAVLRIWPLHSLESSLTWLTFNPAVMVAAIYGGLFAGLLATGLACVTVAFLWPLIVAHPFIQSNADWLGMGFFILTGSMISAVAEAMLRARSRAIKAQEQIQATNDSLKQKELEFMQYAAIIESSSDAIMSKNLEGIITSWNTGSEKMFGYSRNEILGKPISILIPDQYQPEELMLREKISKGISVKDFDTARRCKDGRLIYVSVTHSPIRDSAGHVIGVSKVSRDITERKKLEMALAANEKEFSLLAEAMPQIVWITRSDGWNIYFNRQWVDYTGLSIEDSHGHGWNKPFHPEDKLIAWNAWQNAVKNKATYSLECRLRRADGEYRWWLIRGVPVEDKFGIVKKWFGTCTYIHDLKQAEVELRNAATNQREMIEKNNQLTREISLRNADLSALASHIQKVSETEKSNLARELHDELGSILAALSMEIGRMKRKTTIPELIHDLSLIKELVSNASNIKRNIINQLYPTILDHCGLYAAIDSLVKEYRSYSGIAVELILQGEEVVMEHTFALAAYRITQECLTNIAKHANAYNVHIEIKTIDDFLELTIQDDGKGLPAEIESGRLKTDGHGIFGMTERARYLGGLMKIGSPNGNGTTVHLTLPLAAVKPKSRKRVLVVDDHAIVRDALRQLLDNQSDDFAVEGEAVDGNEAIKMAVEGTWDLMLLDISLPKIHGIKVLETVKELKSDLPIIMISSHAKDEYSEIALSKGASGYIEKGETDKLIEAMRRASPLC